MTGPDTRWLDRRFRDRPDSGVRPEADLGPALARWQLTKLAETLDWARTRSPWYGRLFSGGEAEKAAAELRRLAARGGGPAEGGELLARLPPTAGEALAADSDAFLAVGHDEVEGVVSVPTSGTSGPAKRIRSTAADLAETVAFFQYGMRYLVEPGRDRVALAMSPPRPGNVADLLGRALGALGLPFTAPGFVPEEGEARWLEELAAWRPTCLVGVPPQMVSISRRPEAAPLAETLSTMLLSGDVADDGLVAELERNLPGCRVFRHYGLTEAGLGGAVECGRRRWPHLRDDLWAEILDPVSLKPLPPGRPGEIVLTPLTRRAQPLVRYRTGDEGRLEAEDCPCGSLRPRLRVFGRLEDRLALPGGRFVRASDFEAPLLALPFVRNYSLTLHPGPGLALTLGLQTLEPRPAGAERLAAEAVRAWLGPEAGPLTLAVEIDPAPPAPEIWKAAGGKRRLRRSDSPLGGRRVFKPG